MKQVDFVNEMDDEFFPREVGPWISVDTHEPPFTKTVLRDMESSGVIIISDTKTHYRLTLKATKIKLSQ